MSENQFEHYDKIIDTEIADKMKSSYIEYAMSVIVSRALPDVRDGLKPVHRRILYAMNKLNLDPSKGYKKCANIVGETMGKYHPHGDAAIYDALVRMAQDFSMRYMLVDGHGNFGSIDGYPAAAHRYTEAKLSKIAVEMLSDIEKNTVDFTDNYDSTEKEPTVLPSRFPNLLVNGSSGIAVGMATNIPPHNLTEVIDGLLKIIDNKIEENRDTDIEEILNIIKGPDFPTGATILGKAGIRMAYTTGRGRIRVRSTANIETTKTGKERIIITEIPYQVNKSRMIEKIAELVKDKKVDGITDINDESDRNGIRVVIECRKDANANVILNQLYKYSQLQENYSINFLSIVDGVPKTLNLKEILQYYLKHQEEVVTRRTQFDLDKALKRAHIVEGLLKALDFIDEIINIIRSNKDIKDAKAILMDRFDFTFEQVDAICEMRLRSLSGLEREKLDEEFAKLNSLIDQLQAILGSENRLLQVIKEELLQTKAKFGDERLTAIVQDEGDLYIEDLIEDEMSVITMTHLDYIKRLPLSTYKSQNRGGKGIIGMQTRDEDFVKNLFLSSNHSFIYFFTNKGKVYRIKTFEIPEAGRTAKGTPIINLLQLDNGEKITAVIPVKQNKDNEDIATDEYLAMTTKKGIIKKTKISMFNNIRKMGLIAVNLREDDELISVQKITDGKHIFLATKFGMSIRFSEEDIRELGRNATGVKAITLNKDDEVVASEVIEEDKKVLIVSEKGFGKCTLSDEYRAQTRGGKGLKTYKITERTGNVIDVKMIDEKEELIMVTSEGVIIRIRAKDISTTSRVTQGVKLINIDDDVKVMSVAKISEDYIENEDIEDII
ncbi:DNA gyrase subunit A [uncultured Tyzzerella sp.]|uniref:DNA gyrase subunit A n=1 Tax=uncultured Tyzzerella sp. TaxID=2321398 RepID=UPI0029422CB0|nr:DNA gyrase subunit A [uncultured Tyzzerella sp.]